MKKRILAMLLLLVTALAPLGMITGCAATDEEDYGAEITAFFVEEVYDFDPAKAYTNDDAMKIMSLIYETLFDLDANGNIQYGLADDYEFYEDRGSYCLDIHLRDTYWSDGSQVTASDVAYAWQRILDPNFPCQAATLLYEVKYAKEAKLNIDGKTKFDALITAQDQVLTVVFEEELTPEGQKNFLRNLTSVALAPIKETAVTRFSRDNWWTKRVSTIVTNGPFSVRAMNYGLTEAESVLTQMEFRLDRNNYYRRPQGSTSAVDQHVTPYKFLTYWDTELTDAFADFLAGSIFYVGDIPLEAREEYLKKADVRNLLSTYTYILDNDDPTFANAKVRRALSLALDRALITSEATKGLGVAATGFISHGVFNGASGSFADVTAASEAALASSPEMQMAKELIQAAVRDDGYECDDIRILVRDNAEEKAIAEMVKTAWETVLREGGAGKPSITVTAKSMTSFKIIEDENEVIMPLDTVQEAYSFLKWNQKTNGENVADVNGFTVDGESYNVLAIDYQMLTPDAFSALASFSLELSGNGIRLGGYDGVDEIRTHICGFENDAYNKLIDDALVEKDMAKRAEILHEAEALLLDEMPVIPILFNRTASMSSSLLKRVYNDYYGYAVFTRTELRNYRDHLIPDPDEEN